MKALRYLLVWAGISYSALYPHSTNAMTFTIIETQAVQIDGHNFPTRKSAMASGPIEVGDAKKLVDALNRADRDFFGNISIFLDSDGGSVSEALEMVKVTDAYEVSTFVPSNASCGSACASILYVSGRFHTVLEGGRLGFHGCRVGNVAESSICAEVISENAVRHGTDFMAVQMWLRNWEAAKDGVVWLGRNDACSLGLCGPPSFEYVLAVPPFDCTRASLEAEITVCNNPKLARYEASIANHYKALSRLASHEQWDDIKTLHADVLRQVNECKSDYRCLLLHLASLRAALKRIHNMLTIESLTKTAIDNGVDKDEVAKAQLFYSPTAKKLCGSDTTFDLTCEFSEEDAAIRTIECMIEEKSIENKGEDAVERFVRVLLPCTYKMSKEIMAIQ